MASGKMRICRPADFQTCKMRMVLRIFIADVTGKMQMRTQCYKLKKHIHFVEIFIAGTTSRAIYVRYNTSKNKVVEIQQTSGLKFTILWGHVEEILLLNKFFPIVDTCLSCKDIAQQRCAMVPRWRFLATFLGPAFAASACSTFQTCILYSH